MLVFSVTPFKIDRNKNQNRSIVKVQNLENERRYIYRDLGKIQVRGVFGIRDIRRNVLPKLIETSMETPCWCSLGWAPTWRTVCNSSMFYLVVLAHTDKQYNNLLNTRELIIVINVRLSNRYFTRFIWQRLRIHFEVNWVTCSSYVRLQSIVTPRFFADLDNVISLLSSVMFRQKPIKWSLHLPYEPLKSTFSRVDL